MTGISHPIAASLRDGTRPVMRPDFDNRLFLDHGHPFAPAALPKGVRRRPPKTCFKACAEFVLDGRNEHRGLRYVEGVAMRPSVGMLIAHAWLTDGENAFDITWRDFSGGENLDCHYFGIEFNPESVARILHARGYYGLLDPIDEVVMAELAPIKMAA